MLLSLQNNNPSRWSSYGHCKQGDLKSTSVFGEWLFFSNLSLSGKWIGNMTNWSWMLEIKKVLICWKLLGKGIADSLHTFKCIIFVSGSEKGHEVKSWIFFDYVTSEISNVWIWLWVKVNEYGWPILLLFVVIWP